MSENESKITVSTESAFAKTVFKASITLEISPPDATFINGFKFSEIFVEIKNSILSKPVLHKSHFSHEISN